VAIIRLEGNEKVIGESVFAGDMHLDGTLVGKILRSKVAHARIKHILTSRAAELPGVRAVITGQDFPSANIGVTVKDEVVMPRDKIRYIGEPIAAVAAVDEETAMQALKLIELDLEELPGIFSAEEGLAENAQLIHENWQDYSTSMPLRRNGNIVSHVSIKKGNVDQGFAESDIIVEDLFSLPLVHHAPMEPKAAVANLDPSGKLTVWCSTQSPFAIRHGLATYLQIPISRVRVVGVRVEEFSYD
jgi:carbon-monoxide dehydrogenase large subunit